MFKRWKITRRWNNIWFRGFLAWFFFIIWEVKAVLLSVRKSLCLNFRPISFSLLGARNHPLFVWAKLPFLFKNDEKIQSFEKCVFEKSRITIWGRNKRFEKVTVSWKFSRNTKNKSLSSLQFCSIFEWFSRSRVLSLRFQRFYLTILSSSFFFAKNRLYFLFLFFVLTFLYIFILS